MKTSIKKLPDSKVEIIIEISASDFDRYLKQAALDLGKEVKMKGFRPGHVPEEIIEKQVGKEGIMEEAAEKAIKESYARAVTENNLEAIERPKVEIVKLAPQNPLVFKATTTVLPEVELSDYKKIATSIKKKEISVKDEEIKETLKKLQHSRAKLIALPREAKKGDFVEIEYQCSQIGGGEKKKDSFVLGKGSLIPGFEESLEGMKAGQEKEAKLTLPEGHFVKDLAGKELVFQIKMISVFKMELPELDDRFAKSLGEFKDLESLKKNIEEGIKMEKEREAREKHIGEIMEKIINSMKWNIPDILIKSEKERLFQEFKQNFAQNPQISFSDYLAKTKKTEDEVKDSLSEPARRNIKTFLVLKGISKAEKIEVPEKDLEQEINEILKRAPETAKKNLDLERIKQYTKERMINEKIFQLFQTVEPINGSESTGVGLTLVKKIVEMYDGKLWVESKAGEGSTFFFTLSQQKVNSEGSKIEAGVAESKA